MENTFCGNQKLYDITPFGAVATCARVTQSHEKASKEADHKVSPHLGVQVAQGPLTYRPTCSPDTFVGVPSEGAPEAFDFGLVTSQDGSCTVSFLRH